MNVSGVMSCAVSSVRYSETSGLRRRRDVYKKRFMIACVASLHIEMRVLCQNVSRDSAEKQEGRRMFGATIRDHSGVGRAHRICG